jgi:ergothioneine biosynthesis protein EgtB
VISQNNKSVTHASATLVDDFVRVRQATETLCRPLETEDYGIQTMPDVSPTKWHLAHTSWFFETFILKPLHPGYQPFHEAYEYLFNSYYEGVGRFWQRPHRGLLSRPTVAEIYAYRAHVNLAMQDLLTTPPPASQDVLNYRTVLGLHHEQQHQELMLTDIKHVFAFNPLKPVYQPAGEAPTRQVPMQQWHAFAGGMYTIGADGHSFCYDNETPTHRAYIADFSLASRLVTNGEFLQFMQQGGYREPRFWLSDGWARVQQEGWQAPLYWEQRDGTWWHMTLSGMQPVDADVPVCHVSYYEADAYANWVGARLPTEAEWEVAARQQPVSGNLRDNGRLQPVVAADSSGMQQLYGDVWEWTASAYLPYPGYRTPEGAIGEYNGKFMCNQMVLRGGSCITPQDHIRPSYRNFFYPGDRWQFSGFRLAGDA